MLRAFIFLLFGFIIVVEAKVIIIDNIKQIPNFELEYYYDHNKTETIKTIQDIKFKEKTSNMFTFGYITGNSWFKLTIENQTQNNDYIFQLVEPFFQRVHFYNQKSGVWIKIVAGLKAYQKDKNPQHLTPIFSFRVETNETKTFYIQFAPDAKTAGATFGHFHLATQNSFNHQSLIGNFLFDFLFLGSMFIIILFNFFLFLKFHDVIYLFYALYVLFLSIYSTIYSGLIHHFGLALWYKELSLSLPLFLIFIILFSTYILKLYTYLPTMHKVLKLFALIIFISLPFMLYDYSMWMKTVGIFFTTLSAPLIAISAIYVAYKGDKEAKFYIFGLSFYLIALTLLPLMAKGIIPNTLFTHSAFLLFSYVEVLFFSFVIINRFYAIQNDKILLQGKLLEVQKNTKKTLEKKVKERTSKVNQLLKEKEILLKEVYHRVKNNFHMVTSLLWIEHENQKDKNQKSTLLELMNRIKSMGLIHQYLLGMDDYSQIKAHEYIQRIINEIEKSYTEEILIIDYTIDEFILSPDEALSLGIIINELLTNAVKHHTAYEICRIEIECIENNNEVSLSVQDNGKGFDINASRYSFGLQLIEEFAEKINASKDEFSFEKGTKYMMQFRI
ncbi:MAG: 7TM diverse intracellular signaling domain-containing protein [Sulfurovum sp.]